MEYLIIGHPWIIIRRCLRWIWRRWKGCRYYQPNKQKEFFPAPVQLRPVIKNNFNSCHQTVINDWYIFFCFQVLLKLLSSRSTQYYRTDIRILQAPTQSQIHQGEPRFLSQALEFFDLFMSLDKFIWFKLILNKFIVFQACSCALWSPIHIFSGQ